MPGLHLTTRHRRRTSSVGGAARLAAGGLTGDLLDALDRGTRGADRHLDDSAREYLPTRGGFAAELARKSEMHRTRIRDGYRLQVDAKGADVARINAGRLRRMVFGHRDRWVTQTVRRGFADETLRRVKVDVDREVRRTVTGGG